MVWHAMSQLQQMLLSFTARARPPRPAAALLRQTARQSRSPRTNGPWTSSSCSAQSVKPLARDAHLSLVDFSRPNAVSFYARTQQRMLAQIDSAGLEADTMASYNATPIATYARINAATIRVEAGRAAEFRKLLEARGFKVYDNTRRQIVEPVPVKPEDMDPAARGAISMEENLKITKANSVQALAQKAWGAPELGAAGRFLLKVFGVDIPQPAVGVIDTGADLKHPLLSASRPSSTPPTGPTWTTTAMAPGSPA